jgi:hypothetical protein
MRAIVEGSFGKHINHTCMICRSLSQAQWEWFSAVCFVAAATLLALQTYTTACQWVEIVQQMFAETGLPLVAVVANKADSQDLQAAAPAVPSCVPTMPLAGGFIRCTCWLNPLSHFHNYGC